MKWIWPRYYNTLLIKKRLPFVFDCVSKRLPSCQKRLTMIINKPFHGESTSIPFHFPTVFQMNHEMDLVQPQLYTIFWQKRFPLMFPETTLSFLVATLNLNQTLTSESVFQYGMDYGVNFQIKKKWILYPLLLLCLFRTKANLKKRVYTLKEEYSQLEFFCLQLRVPSIISKYSR